MQKNKTSVQQKRFDWNYTLYMNLLETKEEHHNWVSHFSAMVMVSIWMAMEICLGKKLLSSTNEKINITVSWYTSRLIRSVLPCKCRYPHKVNVDTHTKQM
jgi:hypothetical protein